MPLISCFECGKQISDRSDMCVACGAPTSLSIESSSGERPKLDLVQRSQPENQHNAQAEQPGDTIVNREKARATTDDAYPNLNFKSVIEYNLKNYGKFSGRASRKEYTLLGYGLSIVVIGSYIIDELLGGFTVIPLLAAISVLTPAIAASTRRMHDIGRSGAVLWLLILPFINFYPLFLLCKRGEETPNKYGGVPYSK